jgi:hypothetical protein
VDQDQRRATLRVSPTFQLPCLALLVASEVAREAVPECRSCFPLGESKLDLLTRAKFETPPRDSGEAGGPRTVQIEGQVDQRRWGRDQGKEDCRRRRGSSRPTGKHSKEKIGSPFTPARAFGVTIGLIVPTIVGRLFSK